MMLWDIIRDFFVKYVFGGLTSSLETYNGFFGNAVYYYNNGDFGDSWGASANEAYINTGFFISDDGVNQLYLTLPDYLSTSATIIVLVVLAIVVALGIRWLFRFLISRFTKWGL